MEEFNVIDPRFHDNMVLLPDYRIKDFNKVIIKHHDFAGTFLLSGQEARKYSLEAMKSKRGNTVLMRVIPYRELIKETIVI